MNNRHSDKLLHISKLQSLGVVLVVVGHSIFPDTSGYTPALLLWLHKFIYSFHMALFVFISGFLFMRKAAYKQLPYLHLISNRAFRLLIPYIVFSTLAFFPKNLFSVYADRDIEFSLQFYLMGLIYPDKNPIVLFWFLPALFNIFLISPLLLYTIKTKNAGLISLTVCILTGGALSTLKNYELFSIGPTIHYMLYFYIGCLFYIAYEQFLYTINIVYILLSFTFLTIMNLIPYCSDLLFILTSLIGIVFTVSLCYYISIFYPNCLSFVDGYYFPIFLLSWFFQVAARTLYRMDVYPYYMGTVFSLIGGLILPVFVAHFAQKNNLRFKFILGL